MLLVLCLLLLPFAAADCTAVVGDESYQLSALDADYTYDDGVYNFYFRLCSTLSTETQNSCRLSPSVLGNYSASVFACQASIEADEGWLLGDLGRTKWGAAPSWAFVDGNSANGLVFTAANGQANDAGVPRLTRYILTCNQSATDPPSPALDTSVPYVYALTFTTALSCPSNGKEKSKASSGLSGGSIFLIVFFITFAVYFLVGGLVMRVVYKAEGRRIVPNVEFWLDLPGLVVDGCKLTYAKIASLRTGGVYETMKDPIH